MAFDSKNSEYCDLDGLGGISDDDSNDDSNDDINDNDNELKIDNKNINKKIYKIDKSVDAIKFMKSKMIFNFTKNDSNKLFNFYSLTQYGILNYLTLNDIHQFLFDLCKCNQYPMIVPEILVHDIIQLMHPNYNDNNEFSRDIWDSFFVFDNVKPLSVIFDHIKAFKSKKLIENAKIVRLFPSNMDNNIIHFNDKMIFNEYIKDVIFHKIIVSDMHIYLNENENVLIYFVMCEWRNENEMKSIESNIEFLDKTNYIQYTVNVVPFDWKTARFPPIYRNTNDNGIKSKIAKTLSSTINLTKNLDNKLNISNKLNGISNSIKNFNDKYKVTYNLNIATQNMTNKIKKIDNNYKIQETISHSSKKIDATLGLSNKYNKAKQKISCNKNVMALANKINIMKQTASKNINEIKTETQDRLDQQNLLH